MNLFTKSILVSSLFISGCGAAIIADRPEAETTISPKSPGPTYVWINDSWNWDRNAHVYVKQPGTWQEPKRKSATWVDGRWEKVRGGWRYVKGHWQ